MQILESAITVFDEQGFTKASLSRIAEHANVSKGVISYYFAGKEELMQQLIKHVYERITSFVVPRVTAEPTVIGRLRERIRAVAAFTQQNPSDLHALSEVLNNLRDSDGALLYGDTFNEPIYQGLEEEFRVGQESGELRDFDRRVMAVTVQAGIDAMIVYWRTDPDRELTAYANELGDFFARAIAATPETDTVAKTPRKETT